LRHLAESTHRQISQLTYEDFTPDTILTFLDNLERQRRFREDLFFRLDVLSIEMPPLCERREDIPLLAADFIRKHRHIWCDPHSPVLGISPEAHLLLVWYSWPGNVRELENAIELAITLGITPYIIPADLPRTISKNGADFGEGDLYEKELNAFKKSLFESVLVGGSRLEAARRLGLYPT
jgi:DNA-binding NtrC family response regulator